MFREFLQNSKREIKKSYVNIIISRFNSDFETFCLSNCLFLAKSVSLMWKTKPSYCKWSPHLQMANSLEILYEVEFSQFRYTRNLRWIVREHTIIQLVLFSHLFLFRALLVLFLSSKKALFCIAVDLGKCTTQSFESKSQRKLIDLKEFFVLQWQCLWAVLRIWRLKNLQLFLLSTNSAVVHTKWLSFPDKRVRIILNSFRNHEILHISN